MSTTPVPPGRPPGGTRLVRYAVTGGLSTATHVGSMVLLVELAGMRPVLASAIGFTFSIAVSYLLQKAWVFRSTARHAGALPKFLVAAAAAALLNTTVLTLGVDVLGLHYLPVQVVALVLIPMSNYLVNSAWTFR